MSHRNDPVPPRDWLDRAVCREEDPELFFPANAKGPGLVQTNEAKAVCQRCPVRAACLLWALETGQENGVWGGLDEDELRAIRDRAARDRRKAAQAEKAKDAKDGQDVGRQEQRRHTPATAPVLVRA